MTRQQPFFQRSILFAAALTAALIHGLALAQAGENETNLEGFKPIKVAPGYAISDQLINVIQPFLLNHPEGLGGRQGMEMSVHKGNGEYYVVDIIKSGYLDDSVSGEHYRGHVIQTTKGWELLSIGVKYICYRSTSDSGKCL